MKIIDILKNFFRKFRLNKTKMIEENNVQQTDLIVSNEDKKELFKKSIDVSKIVELEDLQKKLEKNEISVNDLNIFEVMDLIDRYKIQINMLNKKNESY